MDSDRESYIYEAIIFVPLKMYKDLENYNTEAIKVENAINESADSNGIHLRKLEWKPYLETDHNKNINHGEKIVEILDKEYVSKQIRLMNQSVSENPHLALGTAKELIETCCKFLLIENKTSYSKDWDLPKLIKETNKVIDLIPFEVENKELAITSTSKILSGFSNIVHGVTELRNSYGSGHGHEPSFKMIDEIYIKLAVGAASELALFYLSLHDLKS
jgi:hypothetical protein